jgi:hypothetical protein
MKILSQITTLILGGLALFASFAGLLVFLGLLWSIPTMLLWDFLMPEIFGLTTITIWQAWGLNILSGILFKSKTKEKKSTSSNKPLILG